MNNPHQNARMTPLGRAEMVRRIVEEGRPVAEVAAGFGVSERTARKWLGRSRKEGAAGLENRSSRPRSVANRTLDPWIDLMEKLRRGATAIIVVMASFGASMALRSLLEFLYTSKPAYYSRELQIAMPLPGGIRATPDQLLLIGLAFVAVIAVHLLLTRTDLGRAMRAVSENPALAGVVGIDTAKIVRAVWIIGGALACTAGTMSGLLVQIRPYMGFDLLLPLFAAVILGGIGSVPGAMLGGLIVGLCEALAVQTIGAEWRAAVAFAVITVVLVLRPTGLFGRAA